MVKTTEENALAIREKQSSELAPTAGVARVQQEIQAQVIIARKYPRDEAKATAKLLAACDRLTLAEDAAYSFPRGKKEDGSPNIVSGPSVYIAREGARCWGNIRSGFIVINDDEESRTIRGEAWDLESNDYRYMDDTFGKLIFRKGKGWITPDERELRELTNRRGAIVERNAILKVMPDYLFEDALERAKATIKREAAKNTPAAVKRMIDAFRTLREPVTREMLEKKLSKKIEESTPDEITELRTIYASIRDGNSTWAEYTGEAAATSESPKSGERGSLSMEDLKAPESPAASESTPEEKPAPPPGEDAEISDDQYTAITDALQESSLKLGDVQKFMKTIGYTKGLVKNLKQKDVEKILEFIRSGGK